ncbi:hypothetical protein ACIP6X_38830 [Streptomyces coeruleorubidus]|jgi:hypothetical protein|uniref:hypothetical protein n=1 Tax=Streptomyces coeruleorubidus TaxID=116188 RepID=UPI0037FA4A53
MRTFVSGLVFRLPAVGVLALAPGPAVAGTRQPGREGSLPGRFTWSSSGPLISPKPDAGHPVLSVRRCSGTGRRALEPRDGPGLQRRVLPAALAAGPRPPLLTRTNSTC